MREAAASLSSIAETLGLLGDINVVSAEQFGDFLSTLLHCATPRCRVQPMEKWRFNVGKEITMKMTALTLACFCVQKKLATL